MTTIVFDPNPNANFRFNPTLDGVTYNAICTWNLYGQRYYVSIYDNVGTLMVSRPIIGSPDNYDIDIVKGFFTSTLVYRVSSNSFIITP